MLVPLLRGLASVLPQIPSQDLSCFAEGVAKVLLAVPGKGKVDKPPAAGSSWVFPELHLALSGVRATGVCDVLDDGVNLAFDVGVLGLLRPGVAGVDSNPKLGVVFPRAPDPPGDKTVGAGE